MHVKENIGLIKRQVMKNLYLRVQIFSRILVTAEQNP